MLNQKIIVQAMRPEWPRIGAHFDPMIKKIGGVDFFCVEPERRGYDSQRIQCIDLSPDVEVMFKEHLNLLFPPTA